MISEPNPQNFQLNWLVWRLNVSILTWSTGESALPSELPDLRFKVLCVWTVQIWTQYWKRALDRVVYTEVNANNIILKLMKSIHHSINNDFTTSLFMFARYSNPDIDEMLCVMVMFLLVWFCITPLMNCFALSISFAILDSFMVAGKRNIEVMLFNFFLLKKSVFSSSSMYLWSNTAVPLFPILYSAISVNMEKILITVCNP